MNPRLPYGKLIILVVLLAVLGALVLVQWNMRTAEPGKPVVVQEKATLSIFVPDLQGKLIRKTVEIKGPLPDREKADFIFRELKGEKVVPEKLSLYEFAADSEGTIYLNLSQDIKSEKIRPTKEIGLVFSIVNSFLSTFKDAKKVQLLVEGEGIYTTGGLLFTYLPLEFNNQLTED
jgi:hypothetical protein